MTTGQDQSDELSHSEYKQKGKGKSDDDGVWSQQQCVSRTIGCEWCKQVCYNEVVDER
jgi:hypothetical protein